MTADECRLILKRVFKKLYPNCTVQDSYPGDLPRPPLPYIVLDFGRVDTQKVDSSFNGKDGILYQSWHQSMPLTVELVSSSKTKHTDKEKLTSRSTVVDDLVQAVLFFQSPMARDKMLTLNMAVSESSSPERIYNGGSGVERARCSFLIDYTLNSKEYAALHPLEGEYLDTHPTKASKEIADMEAGYFESVEIQFELDKGEKTQ